LNYIGTHGYAHNAPEGSQPSR